MIASTISIEQPVTLRVNDKDVPLAEKTGAWVSVLVDSDEKTILYVTSVNGSGVPVMEIVRYAWARIIVNQSGTLVTVKTASEQ